VSEDFFSVLGAHPLTGRFFVKDDHLENAETPDHHQRSVVETPLRLRPRDRWPPHQSPRTDRVVIGVASRQSDYPLGTQIWFPFISSDAEKDPVDNWEYEAIARLAPA